MEFFKKAFDWLADVSSKLPKVDFQIFFIAVAAVLFGLGIVFAFTYLGSKSFKLIKASKKIQKYLEGVDTVDDDNVSDFTAHCFSAKAPQALRDSWVQYLGVRFGYPSDIVSDKNVYDKTVKKNKDYRAGIYICVSLILLALFAFWGYGTLDKTNIGTVHFVSLVIIGLMYLFLILINRSQNKRCLEVFDAMQEDLDAKVNLQVEKNYATDSSPLSELAGMVEEIIARNTSKAIDLDEEPEEVAEPTPIEALIEQEEKGESAEEETPVETEDTATEDAEETPVDEEPVEETTAEDTEDVEETPVDAAEETAEEETEEVVETEPAEETVEEAAEENVEETVEESTDEAEEVEEAQEETTEEQPLEEEQEETLDETEPQEETEEVQEEETSDETEEEPVAEENADGDALEEVADESEEVEENQEETVEEQPVEEEAVEDTEEQAEEEVSEENDEEPVDETEEGDEEAEEVEESEEVEDESEEETQEEAEEDPEVVYVVDGEEEDDEVVKPAKLVKLPNLVDYMLTKNMPKAMKIQIAGMLISTYKKFENSKEDRKIVVQCLTKVMRDLQAN